VRLSKNEKEHIASFGCGNDIIEEKIDTMTFAIFFEDDVDICKMIDADTAERLLGRERLLDEIAKSLIIKTASYTEIPRTLGEFSIEIDPDGISCNSKDTLNINVDSIIKIQSEPQLFATNIDWDISSEEELEAIGEYYPTSTIRIPQSEWKDLVAEELKTDVCGDIISDYISDLTGFCHYGFTIESNFNKEELEKFINSSKNEEKKALATKILEIVEVENELTLEENDYE